MSATKERPAATDNGTGTDPLAEAFARETEIADAAAAIRGDAKELTPELFMKLWPLLRESIPPGFITSTEPTKGKPYPSTGIKSVQVCIDRMDNVLTPLWWSEDVQYFDEGKRCQVTVNVAGLFERESQGGVNQASTTGNLYKGSYTNAAKRAFAMVGVGHEVYLGATDLDPDVSPDAAKAQEKPQEAADAKLPQERADKLQEIVKAAGLEKDLPTKLRGFGAKELTDLTEAQAIKVYEWASDSVEAADGA